MHSEGKSHDQNVTILQSLLATDAADDNVYMDIWSTYWIQGRGQTEVCSLLLLSLALLVHQLSKTLSVMII